MFVVGELDTCVPRTNGDDLRYTNEGNRQMVAILWRLVGAAFLAFGIVQSLLGLMGYVDVVHAPSLLQERWVNAAPGIFFMVVGLVILWRHWPRRAYLQMLPEGQPPIRMTKKVPLVKKSDPDEMRKVIQRLRAMGCDDHADYLARKQAGREQD